MAGRPYVTSEPLTVELNFGGSRLIRAVFGADGAQVDDIGWLKLYLECDTRPGDIRATVYRMFLAAERGIVTEHAGVSNVTLKGAP